MCTALFSLLFIILTNAQLVAEQGVFRYREVRGATTSIMELMLRRSASGFILSFTQSTVSSPSVTGVGRSVTEEVRWNSQRGTVAWRKIGSHPGTDISGVRKGNVITVKGRLRGKDISQEFAIDSLPWYQILGPAIGDLLHAGADRAEFWAVDPDDIAAHKMMARRAGMERRRIGHVLLETFKVHFSLAGALSFFWGADYWYRISDSAYVYSQLPETGGATVMSIIW